MNIEATEHRDCIVINLTGDLDLYTAPDLKRAFIKKSKNMHSIILNLNGVNYIDSSGVGVLLFAFSNSTQNGKKFTICNLNINVKEVLRLSQLDKFLPISLDLDDAVNNIIDKVRA